MTQSVAPAFECPSCGVEYNAETARAKGFYEMKSDGRATMNPPEMKKPEIDYKRVKNKNRKVKP